MKRFGNILAQRSDPVFAHGPSVRAMGGNARIGVADGRVTAYLTRDGVAYGPQIVVMYDPEWLAQQDQETITDNPRWQMISLIASMYFDDVKLSDISAAIHWASQV